MSILQNSITLDSNGKLNTNIRILNTFSSCFLMFFGGKYINNINNILKQLTREVGKLPLAIFLVIETFNKKQDIELKYSFNGQKSLPVMVVYID